MARKAAAETFAARLAELHAAATPGPEIWCTCGHLRRQHVHFGQTGLPYGRECEGWHGSATPGPFRPCNCRTFEPFAGSWNAATGEAVQSTRLST